MECGLRLYQVAPDKHLLFFKSGQADAITACFSEYSKRLLKRTKSAKAPIREQIKEAAAEAARQPAQSWNAQRRRCMRQVASKNM